MKSLDYESVKEILGRALLDQVFREELLANPEQTIAGLGFTQSEDSLEFFESLTEDGFEAYAESVDERVGGLARPSQWK